MWFLNAGSVQEVLIGILSMLVIIFAVLPLHEFAHGWVAYKLGDSTAKYNGRLTLNPVAHIDPLGALALILFRFGWPSRFRSTRAILKIPRPEWRSPP